MGPGPKGLLLRFPPLSPTDAGLACPPCCPCVCHIGRPGLELRWVPVGGYEDGPRAFCRASPLRASRSRPNPPSISLPPVVLTSYRSTAERKLLPPLKAPKPTWVRQDIAISGDPPKPDLDLPSEDGIQTGTGPRVVGLWVGKGRGGGREVEKPTTYNPQWAWDSRFLHQLLPWGCPGLWSLLGLELGVLGWGSWRSVLFTPGSLSLSRGQS